MDGFSMTCRVWPRVSRFLVGLVVVGMVCPIPAALAAQRATQITGDVEAYTVASGLQGPDGLSFHPETGDVYVSEKAANRISVIRDGSRSTVIETGWTVTDDIPAWHLSSIRTKEYLTESQLHEPGPISFSSDGHLFVAEDRGHGRLLEFIPDEKGKFSTARCIAVPWIDKPFAWDDIKVRPNGEMFVVGYDEKGEGTLHFGSVLMLDTNQDWWVIDYGPFSRFSGFYLSRSGDVLVVGERTKGEIVAWDLFRHSPIGTVPRSVAEGNA